MYLPYRKFVLGGSMPSSNLSKSICSTITLGSHIVTFTNLWYFSDKIKVELVTSFGDTFEDWLWIWDKDCPGKLSWKLWRLVFAVVGDYGKTLKACTEVRKNIQELDNIVGHRVKALVRDSDGFKISRDLVGQFWLVDGPSGSKLVSFSPFNSYNEAKQAGLKAGLKQSFLTVARWDRLDG